VLTNNAPAVVGGGVVGRFVVVYRCCSNSRSGLGGQACPAGSSGQSDQRISMQEVQVWDVALTKNWARASNGGIAFGQWPAHSCGSDGEAQYAIDGSTQASAPGSWCSSAGFKSFSSFKYNNYSYWMIDLGQQVNIGAIRVISRADADSANWVNDQLKIGIFTADPIIHIGGAFAPWDDYTPANINDLANWNTCIPNTCGNSKVMEISVP
jgi:hypothetical protein